MGPNPRSATGENEYFEKITRTKKRMGIFSIAVAVGMSLVLALMAFLVTVLLNLHFADWIRISFYVLGVLFGAVFVAIEAYLLSRLFSVKLTRVVVAAGVVVIAVLWFVWPNWLTVDLAAIVLIVGGLSAFLQYTLNFPVVALAGGGLVVYDIVNVYFTGNMMRVAVPMMESGIPGMIVVPQGWALDSAPAAGLGLGDVVFPGLMIMLAAVLSYRHNNKSVLYGGLIGYLVGMVLIFAVLYLTETGQPALITLYPCVLAGILLAAQRAGLLKQLFSMRHRKPHAHAHDGCNCIQNSEN